MGGLATGGQFCADPTIDGKRVAWRVMGWTGVWLVPRTPGESDRAAIDRTAGESIEWDDDGVRIVATDNVESPDLDDDFIFAVTNLVRSINPRLDVIDESLECGDLRRVTLDDGDGPVIVHLYPGEVQLKPSRGWSDPPGEDGAGFHALWSYMRAIGGALACVAHDPDFDEVFDLGLDEARGTYNLL